MLFVVLLSPHSSDLVILEGDLDRLLDLRGGDGAVSAPSFPVAKNRSTASAARSTPSSIERTLGDKGIDPPGASSVEDVILPALTVVPVFSSAGSISFALALDRRFAAASFSCFLSLALATSEAILALASASLALAAAISASFLIFSTLSRLFSSASIRRSVASRALSRFLISFLILEEFFLSDLFAVILASDDLGDLDAIRVLFGATVGACEYP